MLKISRGQFDALRESRIRNFESEMVEHLSNFAPRHIQVLGEAGTLKAVRFGIDRAVAIGFTACGPIRSFLETMMTLGGRFDEDPIYLDYFQGVFTDGDDTQQLSRAKMLYNRLCEYLEEVAGPGRVRFIDASRRLLARANDSVPENVPILEFLMWEAATGQPERMAYLGEDAHRVLLTRTLDLGQTMGLRSRRNQVLFGILALFAGHSFHDDPLYPWIARTLNKQSIGDMDARATRLESRAKLYLDAMIESSG